MKTPFRFGTIPYWKHKVFKIIAWAERRKQKNHKLWLYLAVYGKIKSSVGINCHVAIYFRIDAPSWKSVSNMSLLQVLKFHLVFPDTFKFTESATTQGKFYILIGRQMFTLICRQHVSNLHPLATQSLALMHTDMVFIVFSPSSPMLNTPAPCFSETALFLNSGLHWQWTYWNKCMGVLNHSIKQVKRKLQSVPSELHWHLQICLNWCNGSSVLVSQLHLPHWTAIWRGISWTITRRTAFQANHIP